ncbi:hypothetical protein V7793_05975 [Streptomyces sp. KLMMK]|uniref:hypothetical protein n=1 Tax=Streptomyces sp. KLMMK TaxID=3109353 RepID=UPI002FFFA458
MLQEEGAAPYTPRPSRRGLPASARTTTPAFSTVRALGTGDVQQGTTGLLATGLVRLERLADRDAAARFATRVMRVQRITGSGPDGLTSTGSSGGPQACARSTMHVPGGPATAEADLAEPPRLLLLACLRAPAQGVPVHLVDGRRAYRELQRRYPVSAVVFADEATALFAGRGGGVRGPVFARRADGRVAFRLGVRGCVRWCPAAAVRLCDLDEAVRLASCLVRLRAGEGLLLDNHRWASCHLPVGGPHLLVRAAGLEQRSHTLPYGFRPASLVVRGRRHG